MQNLIRFVFAISFAPRAVCDSWEIAQLNLRRTITSIRGMACEDYRIVIACHDAPDLREVQGSDIELLFAPFPIETDVMRRGADKIRKRRLVGSWLRERIGDDGAYIMFLDADDLVHRHIVGHVLGQDTRRSHIAEKGYIFDSTTGLLELRSRQFYTTCGSCFVCWFAKGDLPFSFEDTDCLYSQFDLHREFKVTAAHLGKDSEPFPFPAVVYLANHRESLRVKQFDQVREIDLFNLVSPRHAKDILEQDFSCADVAITAARTRPFIFGVAISSMRQLWHRGMRYASPERTSSNGRGDPADVIKEIRGARKNFLDKADAIQTPKPTSLVNDNHAPTAPRPRRSF